MRTLSKLILATSVVFSAAANAIEPPFQLPLYTFKCNMTDAVGFQADRMNWESAKFDVKGNEFLIRPLTEEEKKKHPGFTYGTGEHIGLLHSTCENPHPGIYHCSHIERLGEIKFSSISGRFISTYTGGYWFGGNQGAPAMAIGTCQRV